MASMRERAPKGLAILCLALAALSMSACASARLRTANGAATANISALTAAATAYDAALAPRLDQSISPHWTPHRSAPLTEAEQITLNAKDRDYAESLATLRVHANLLSSYFSVLAEYTAPGTNSATTHTDAQLAQAGGIATAVKTINERAGAVASIAARLVIEGVADARLRAHFEDHSEDILEGLLIQQGALDVLERHMTTNRTVACDALYRDLNATPVLSPPRVFTRQEATQYNERRRTVFACTRHADDVAAARQALIAATRSYADAVRGRISPEALPLAINDVTAAVGIGKALLENPPSQERN